ncbi:PQQ-binding-like beta-propeller repeat protein [Candidatus Nitrotoga arctica]|uniref:Quinoprotein glucose dehydrogenase n=1 Tax=Candidatus Nitrotoga arctica TaxID=453162 RepID=A0ABM8YZF6_9PROT|nr:PQQ-binding-like beta-propeller repeat protein [Candidatus Nitrotoga arctica]CAG9932904.1 Quinoprotein glucose dehydrogenase [Candidatus Nitrotoga arctica]
MTALGAADKRSKNRPSPGPRTWPIRIAALILLVFGSALAGGGVILAASGGSLYYLISGVALIASSVLLWRGDARGVWMYGAMLVWTVAWSIWEVGYSGWQLVPRLIAPFVLAALLLLPSVRRLRTDWLPLWRGRGWAAFGGGLIAAVVLGSAGHTLGSDDPEFPALRRGMQAQAPARLAEPLAKIDRDDWQAYGNDQGGTRFSPLAQIDTSNVAGLTKVWEAEMTPTVPGPMNALQVTPLMIGDTLYACDGNNGVHAFDAETGQVRWRQNVSGGEQPSGKPCRGVAYYKVPDASGVCAERIFAPSHNPTLVALDAKTGQLCPGFGNQGSVDLQSGIAPYPHGLFYVSSAPQVIRGKVVVGGGIPDGQYWGGPSGVIRAFDAVTGELAWAYDAGAPERIGAPPPGEFYTPSSPNSWAPISADEALGLVYLPMGGATPDAFGGLRRPFDDSIGSAVIALDAESGRMRWRFQTTHHDIWDYDVASQPTLADVPTPQGVRSALIQPTKRGEIFVLDRRTGEAIKTVRELPAPQSAVAAGERLAKTQPESSDLPAFRGAPLREKDMWGMTPLDQLYCRIEFRRSLYEGMFTPVTLGKNILIDPGSMGGINWNGISLDADRGIMIVNWTQVPDRLELITREEATRRNFKIAPGLDAGGQTDQPMLGTPYGAYRAQFLSPLGSPCTAPPWGLIAGVDLASGKVLWSKPFGTGRDIGPLKLGVRTMLPITIGTPTAGGAVTTRGGLVFIGGAAEHTFRALDTATGKEVWSHRLATSANATPITYRSPISGRQFVVVAEGGRPAYGTKAGTKLVAYALPATKQ